MRDNMKPLCSTSVYLNDLLNIENVYFEQMIERYIRQINKTTFFWYPSMFLDLDIK